MDGLQVIYPELIITNMIFGIIAYFLRTSAESLNFRQISLCFLNGEYL